MRLDLDTKKKYVIACSFGPDSMALLGMALEDKLDVVVAHVNYHKRDISNYEESSLKEFCKANKIVCEVFDTTDLKHEGNFQDWARKIRYDFFKKVVEKYDCDSVLVAHQQDDFLETYLMQKKRGNFVKNPGIAKITTINNVKIVRPLLNYSKQDLLEYCQKNKIPFSIDSSNLTDQYERNKIRHSIVEKMSGKEREELLKEIAEKKTQNHEPKTRWGSKEFLNLDSETIMRSVSEFVEPRIGHHDISKKFIEEIQSAFKSRKSNIVIKLWGDLVIAKEYGCVCLLDMVPVTYKYILDKNDYIDDKLFNIDFRYCEKDRNVSDEDFPITIKPIDKSDKYLIGSSMCEVRRLFIDWKVPKHLRTCWPGIYNKEGKLIYIPRYRENFVDNHPSKFLIKFVR